MLPSSSHRPSPFSDTIRDLMVLPVYPPAKLRHHLSTSLWNNRRISQWKLWRNKLKRNTKHAKLGTRHKPPLPTVYTQPYLTPSRKPWKFRSFYLAYRLTNRGTRFFPTQRSISRCPVSSLWMATPTITILLCMRQDVQRGACTKLRTWWFPNNPP